MKIWFDTEFLENGKTIELISIGLVREDGETYYKETATAKWIVQEDDWLWDNVRPHLRGCTVWPNDQIGKDIVKFVGPNPEFWAYYSSYDWVALCQLFGRMIDLPEDWPKFCRDVKQLHDDLGSPELPKPTVEHDALADAIWTKEAWEFLTSLQNNR